MKKHTFRIIVAVLLMLAFSSFANPQSVRAEATTWTVTSLADGTANAANCNGPNCRLRDAIAAAAAYDTIDFAVTGTIHLSAGELSITQSLAISGPGADLLTIDAGGTSRVMSVNGIVWIALSGMTLTGGNQSVAEEANYGGGIYVVGVPGYTVVNLDKMAITGNTVGSATGYNFGGGLYLRDGTFQIWNTEISNNTVVSGTGTTQGGGIYFRGGSLLIVNSTISGNQAGTGGGRGDVGGVAIGIGGTGTLHDVTIAGNTAGNVAGGLYVHTEALAANVGRSLIADNSAGSYSPDCLATTVPVSSLDYNLIENTSNCAISGAQTHNLTGVDPMLGSLANNGGTTRTMALLEGSPALNAAGDSCNATDQRGIRRPQGAHCDIGAFEYVLPCYVDKDALGANNGHTWTDAYTDLQSALGSNLCYETWVADGIYRPTSGSDRMISFNVPPGTQVYGGFDAAETERDQRDPVTNVTTLSGDIGVGGTASDNSYHVVTIDGTAGTPVTGTTVLDGFTVTAGYADGGVLEDRGGGLICKGGASADDYDRDCSPTLHQLKFVANYADLGGGAVANWGGSLGKSSPTFSDVSFTNNGAGMWGGAMYNDASSSGLSSPTLIDVTFAGNYAYNNWGGAIANFGDHGGNSSPVLGNVTFTGNSAPGGGALYNDGSLDGTSSPTLANVTFYGNLADYGGAIFGTAADGGTSAATLDNVILWGNGASIEGPEILLVDGASSTLNYSVVQGSCTSITGATCGTGNLDTDPLLLGLDNNGGFTQTMDMLPGGSAIDTGSDAICAAFPVDGLDQRGVTRPQGTHCDIGAVEHRSCFVDMDAVGEDTGASWTDAYTDLQSALKDDLCYEIWVADGDYYPTSGSDRTISFNIPPDVQVYGGFDGSETEREQRDPAAHVATLSGDIGVADIATDNSYHVVQMNGVGITVVENTVLDGFTITNGYADGASPADSGGGLYCNGSGIGGGNECSPTLAHLNFVSNFAANAGGAVYNDGVGGKSSPTFNDVSFTNNSATTGGGGAMFNAGNGGVSSPIIRNATFNHNSSSMMGGAIANESTVGGVSSPLLANVTFFDNSAVSGGAMINYAIGGVINPELSNVTFAYNSASYGGALYAGAVVGGGSASTLDNVILWGNTASGSGPSIYHGPSASSTLNYSVVEGGCESIGGATCGTGNLDTDPMLGPLAYNGGITETMALLPGSSAIDTASAAICAAFPVSGEDQRGVTRPRGPQCDIGAFEVVPLELPLVRLFPSDGGARCGRDPIGVILALSDLTRSGDSFDPSRVTLTFDNVDVTREAEVRQTDSYPASHGALAYTPPAPLPPGQYTATFMYPTDGPSQTVLWRFTTMVCALTTPQVPNLLDPFIPAPVVPRDRGAP